MRTRRPPSRGVPAPLDGDALTNGARWLAVAGVATGGDGMNERHALDLLLPLSPTPGGAALLRISARVTEEEWARLLQLLAVLKPGLVWTPPVPAVQDQEVTE